MLITIESIILILTPIIAIYGAVLSTYICIRSIRSERVKVFVTHAWIYGVTAEGMEESPQMLNLYAINECRQDVVIGHLALEIPGFLCIGPDFVEHPIGPKFLKNNTSVIRPPVSTTSMTNHDILKPGHQLEVSFNHSKLVDVLRSRGMRMPIKVSAVFEDSFENVFFSSWFHIGED